MPSRRCSSSLCRFNVSVELMGRPPDRPGIGVPPPASARSPSPAANVGPRRSSAGKDRTTASTHLRRLSRPGRMGRNGAERYSRQHLERKLPMGIDGQAQALRLFGGDQKIAVASLCHRCEASAEQRSLLLSQKRIDIQGMHSHAKARAKLLSGTRSALPAAGDEMFITRQRKDCYEIVDRKNIK